jgi:hypothetical protein
MLNITIWLLPIKQWNIKNNWCFGGKRSILKSIFKVKKRKKLSFYKDFFYIKNYFSVNKIISRKCFFKNKQGISLMILILKASWNKTRIYNFSIIII